MASKRRFYRTTITYVVLSEEPLGDAGDFDLADIVRECDDGALVGDMTKSEQEELDGPQMAKALADARSDAGFFELTDDGEDDGEDAEDA